MKLNLKNEKYAGAGNLASLLEKFIKHTGLTRDEAISELVETGLRRKAALARSQGADWAGKADASYPAPSRKGKGKHKAKK